MEKLRANPSHPTFKKLERLIGLLEHVKINFEWVDGRLKIRDSEFAVSFDLVDESEDTGLTQLPPLFAYKLTRDNQINKYCECRNCNPHFDKDK